LIALLFDVVYQEEIVSEEIFYEWRYLEKDKQEKGHEASVKSAMGFFNRLTQPSSSPDQDDQDSQSASESPETSFATPSTTMKCNRVNCAKLDDGQNFNLQLKCELCPEIEYCSLSCQANDWHEGHSEVHKSLPMLNNHCEKFGKLGYASNGRYTKDENSYLKLVLEWDFDNNELLSNQAPGLTQISQDEEVARIALANNDARKAAVWLTECIEKHDYSAHLANPKMLVVAMASNYSKRAWCNWLRAKSSSQIDKAKRIELLQQVVYDCGFVTGKSFLN
jgi:hypothetical protein